MAVIFDFFPADTTAKKSMGNSKFKIVYSHHCADLEKIVKQHFDDYFLPQIRAVPQIAAPANATARAM